MDKLLDRMYVSLKYNTLDFKHVVRSFLADLKTNSTDYKRAVEMESVLVPLAVSGFDYYAQNKHVFDNDLSLKTVTSLCSFKDLMLDVNAEDKTVHFLSHLFNQIIHSTRGLYECYDCGTNARAMFLHLIEAHRGQLYLSPHEQILMQTMYRPNETDPMSEAELCRKKIKSVPKSTVFICSIGMETSGHVWVIEKIVKHGRSRYHMYQSSLGSHLVLDFIERCGYAENPEQSLNVDQFFTDLKKILAWTDPWNHEMKMIFSKLFAFLPFYDVKQHRNSFCWTYITY